MTTIQSDRAATVARVAIGALLDGQAPNGVAPSDLGPFADVYTEMARAHVSGGTSAAKKVYAAFAGRDAQIAALMAGDPEPPKPKRTRYTVAELYTETFPEVRFTIPDLLPEGQTLLVARPKIGKSWAALQTSVAVGTGGMMFGQRVEHGSVFYLALEDRSRRMLDRLKKMGAPSNTDLVMEHKWPSLAGDGMRLLMNEVEQGGYSLVIVDTLQRAFSGLDVVKDGARITAKLAELQEFALEQHIANIIVHHQRKGSGRDADAIDDVMGATGIAANADASWLISRQRNQRDAILHITGRDIEERELSIKFDKQLFCWQLEGEAAAVRADTVQGRILEALKQFDGKQATPVELGKFLNIIPDNVSRELGILADKGIVERGDKQGRNVFYRLSTAHS
jgi:hypothetical protein